MDIEFQSGTGKDPDLHAGDPWHPLWDAFPVLPHLIGLFHRNGHLLLCAVLQPLRCTPPRAIAASLP